MTPVTNEPSTKSPAWLQILKWVVFLPLAIPALYVHLPTEGALAVAMKHYAITWLLPTFQYVSGHADSTQFRDGALVAHLLSSILIPFTAITLTIVNIFDYPFVRARLIERQVERKLLRNMLLFGPLFAVCTYYISTAMPGDPSWASGLTTSSKVGFSLLKYSSDIVSSYLIGLYVSFTRFWFENFGATCNGR